MKAERQLTGSDVQDLRRTVRRWSTDSLAILVTIDVMAFVAAAWLALGVPDAFEKAADSANLARVMMAGERALHERYGIEAAPAAEIAPPTF